MKRNFIFFIVLLAFIHGKNSFAQDVVQCNNFGGVLSCNTNPVIPIFSDVDILVHRNVRYAVKNKVYDISYKNVRPLLSDCGDIIPYSCTPDPGDKLVYNAYYPSPKKAYPCYKEKPLPAIVLFRGGGFSDCNDLSSGGNMEFYCREFAKRGFVAFDISYRSGKIKDPNFVPGEPKANNYFSASAFLATYRAFQDARGAIRSIIAYQMGPTPPPYIIDTDNIFSGGASAGSFIAMSLGYYSADMLYEIFGNAKTKLGTLDDNAYLGPGAVKFKIRGVLNMWGGAYMPAVYATNPEAFFQKNKSRTGSNLNPPMIAFQGGRDSTIPLTRATTYFSSDSFFSTAPVCSSSGEKFTLPFNDINGPVKDLIFFGSEAFYNLLTKNLGIPSEFYLDSDMKHGLSNTSDFGTNIDVQRYKALIITYIVERAVSFFQAVANNTAENLKDTKFVDCENFRYGCSPENNHEICIDAVSDDSLQQNVAIEKNKKNIFSILQFGRTINLLFKDAGHSEVILFDLYGRALRKIVVNNTRQCLLQCDQLPPGVYIIKAIQGKRSQSQKINIY